MVWCFYQVLRRVLSEPRTVLVGMRTLIRGTSKQDSSSSKNTGSAHSNQEDQATLCLGAKSIALQQREQQPQPQAASSTSGPLLKFMTFHHMIKTCAYPLLVQPVWYIQGFRLLFGERTKIGIAWQIVLTLNIIVAYACFQVPCFLI